jgi:hypothetical protein
LIQEWDETNFLVDLSGYYANCEALKKPHGVITVDRKTRDGVSIGGIVDSIEGRETHVDATEIYINQLIKRWNAGQLYNGLVSLFIILLATVTVVLQADLMTLTVC